MRLVLGAVALAATVATARADGELTVRGAYYKERATRVEQPMLDARFDVGEVGSLEAHFLVDAITSASVGAFEEKRVEGGAGYSHVLGDYTVGGSARYSSEPDYKSAFGTLRFQAEAFDKNLTAGLTVGIGHDSITNAGDPGMTRIAGELDSYLVSASLAQLLGENTVASVVYDLSYLDGYQQNPYRRIGVGGMLALEVHPDTRTRHAAAAMLRRFVPATSTTLIGAYRLYRDDWSILAHTPEVRVVQDVGDTVTFAMSYRYHRQRAADFWKAQYQVGDVYVSDDPKIARLTTHDLAAKLAVTGATLGLEGRWEALRGEAMIEYYVQSAAFGNAIIAHAALTIPFEY